MSCQHSNDCLPNPVFLSDGRAWDTGAGFEKATREFMAKATLAGSIVLTILVWIIAYSVR